MGFTPPSVLAVLTEDMARNGEIYVDTEGRKYRVVKGTATGSTHLQCCDDGLMLPEQFLRVTSIVGFRRKGMLTRLHILPRDSKPRQRE